MAASPVELRDATALVTGAGSGLGRACALALAAEGAAVAVTELPDRLDHAEETAAAIVAAGGAAALALALDVRDVGSIGRCVDCAASWRGRLDVLVNNAGVNVRRPAFEVSEEDWDAVLDVNLRGVFFVAQAVARVMRDQARPAAPS